MSTRAKGRGRKTPLPLVSAPVYPKITLAVVVTIFEADREAFEMAVRGYCPDPYIMETVESDWNKVL